MSEITIYINEISTKLPGRGLHEIRQDVDRAIDALKKMVGLRGDLIVGFSGSMKNIAFGQDAHSLHAIYGWQPNGKIAFLRRLADKSHCNSKEVLNEQVYYNNVATLGMTWSYIDNSFVLSFGDQPPWVRTDLNAIHVAFNGQGDVIEKSVVILNISTSDHVDHLNERIINYGLSLSSSSLIYRGGSFFIRMFLSDHEPPHVHIYSKPDSSSERDQFAKVRIDTLEILKGELRDGIRGNVLNILRSKKGLLMESWKRCRDGRLPLDLN